MTDSTIPRIAVLLIEDNPGDARLVKVLLSESGAGLFALTHCPDLASGLARLEADPIDVILLDLSLPDAHGLDTVRRVQAAAGEKPIVVMTGLDDEQTALEALRAGAQDYLVKGRFDGELVGRAIRYAIERKQVVLELARLNSFKNELLGMAAHDLRNPLTVILACSEFLLDDCITDLSDEKCREFPVRIKKNAEFMLGLINDLLDVSRIESGKLELNLQPTDLAALLVRSLDLNGVIAKRKSITLTCPESSDVPPVMADAQRLEQVVDNLLSNAIKFSRPGTRVRVGIERRDDGVVVAVADEGQGIPTEELDRLFRHFSRTSVRSTGGEKSTGLGLAISRRIIEAHHGRIWAESTVGKGSKFSFSLPLATDNPITSL